MSGWDSFERARAAPNPGSREAMNAGCICPVLDNSYGRGYLGGVKDTDGSTVFVISEGCPLHTTGFSAGGSS